METLICPLFKQASLTPHHLGLITDSHAWSFQELNTLVQRTCHYLKNLGVQSQERIAFVATTQVTTCILLLALFRLQAIACPLSTRIPPEALPSHLQRLNPAHLVDPPLLPLQGPSDSFSGELDPQALATFLFTSGSSAIPKIACHTFANHYYNALGALDALQLNPSSRYLLSLPLFHVGGISILFRTLLSGSTLILSSLPPIEATLKHQVTHLSYVPTQLFRLVRQNHTAPPSLHCVLLGGGPASSQLLHLATQLKWPLYSTYGLTETSSMVTLDKILPFRELQLRNKEIFVRGHVLFQGYWDSQQECVKEATQEGWFATRDLGQFDNEGKLEILGRKDRQFISGGENIQPEEIERALCTLPGILAAHVATVTDPEFGYRPIAFIEDATGTYTLKTLKQALSPLLPSFKHPIQLHPLPLQPKNGSWKR